MNDKEKRGLLEDAIEILRKSVSGFPFKTQAELSRASGESEANISRWLSGASTPTLRRLEPVLMALGVRFALPDEDTRPLRQTEVHAAKSMLNRVDSWKILKDKANLRQTIMLRMPIQDLSMQPTINPGDIVMIDTTLKSPKEKTVCLVEHTDEDNKTAYSFRRVLMARYHTPWTVIFCADNISAGYEPLLLDMNMDADNIIGSVKNVIKSL